MALSAYILRDVERAVAEAVYTLDEGSSSPLGVDRKQYSTDAKALRRAVSRAKDDLYEKYAKGLGGPEEKQSEELQTLPGRLGRLKLDAERRGEKWSGVRVGTEYLPIEAFTYGHPSYDEAVVKMLLRQQAAIYVDIFVAQAVGDSTISMISSREPKVGRQLGRMVRNGSLDIKRFSTPLAVQISSGGGDKAAADKARTLYVELVQFLNDPDEVRYALNEIENRAAIASRDAEVLRAFVAETEGVTSTDHKVRFDKGWCERVTVDGVRTIRGFEGDAAPLRDPEDRGRARVGQVRVLMERPLFQDFVLFYEHNVPRTYGFDEDPRAEYAKAVSRGETSRLTRRQWAMLDRYKQVERKPSLLADYKQYGRIQKGLISRVTERIATLAERGDPLRTGSSRKVRDAMRQLGAVYKALDLRTEDAKRQLVLRIINYYKQCPLRKVGEAAVDLAEMRRGEQLDNYEKAEIVQTIRRDPKGQRNIIGARMARAALYRAATGEDPDNDEWKRMDQAWQKAASNPKINRWSAYLADLPYENEKGWSGRLLKELVTVASAQRKTGYQFLSDLALNPPTQTEIDVILATGSLRSKFGITDEMTEDEARASVERQVRRQRIRKFFNVAKVLGIEDSQDDRILAESANMFVDAEPLTEEGEEAALLAQSLFCAEPSPNDPDMVEIFLTPESAQRLADLLRGYGSYPLGLDIEDEDELQARVAEAESTSAAIVAQLDRIFTPEGSMTRAKHPVRTATGGTLYQRLPGLGCYDE